MNLFLLVDNIVDTDSVSVAFDVSIHAFSRLFKVITIFLVIFFFN